MSTLCDYTERIGTCDVLMMTLDALRFDVADSSLQAGETPNLSRLFPSGWEQRHSPGNFTYAAHAALFAGFWPTPVSLGELTNHVMRPFALSGVPSRTVGRQTCRLGGESIVEGLRRRGYSTVCIGGVGFFDRRSPLGSVFPAMFDVSHWEPGFAPTSAMSAALQSRHAAKQVRIVNEEHPLFLFINYSATHPPTRLYVKGAGSESIRTQQAALRSIDRHVLDVVTAFSYRGRPLLIFCMSDHGTTFGEDGCNGHRVGHPNVWTVPYAEALLEPWQVSAMTSAVSARRTHDLG